MQFLNPKQVTEDKFHLVVSYDHEGKANYDEWIAYLQTSKYTPSIAEGVGCRKMVELLNLLNHIETLICTCFYDEEEENGDRIRGRPLDITTKIDKVILECGYFESLWFEIATEWMVVDCIDDNHSTSNEFVYMNPNPHVKRLEVTDCEDDGVPMRLVHPRFPNVKHLSVNNIWPGEHKFMMDYETIAIDCVNYDEYVKIIKSKNLVSYQGSVCEGMNDELVLPTCPYYKVCFTYHGPPDGFKSVNSTSLESLSS